MDKKSNDVVSGSEIDELLSSYEALLEYFAGLGVKDIASTKLQRIHSIIKERGMDGSDYCRYLIEANRFKRVRGIIEDSEVNLSVNDLKKMLKGSEIAPFYSDESEDAFFEFDFAARLHKLTSFRTIDIGSKIDGTETDVIFNKETAIECKKVHSVKSFRRNFRTANKQIVTRIARDDSVKNGLIAFELTNVFDHQGFREIARNTIPLFYEGYRKLGFGQEEALLKLAEDDKNFRGALQNISCAILEFSFHSMFDGRSQDCKMDDDVMGVIYQAETYFSLDGEGHQIPISMRCATYLENESFKNRAGFEYIGSDVGAFMRSLAVGI
ncbi:hypothetical protein ACFPU0_04860 [Pseudomonas sp. GCM10022186]|uniref:hypothetical protein n=1 Tax=Pseudomonas sp. GCM10022186 TaxID=3252650 RepID=UPI00360DCD5F